MNDTQKDVDEIGSLRPVGVIRSILTARREAPKQGNEGAPDAWLEHPWAAEGLLGPLGLQPVVVHEIDGNRLRIGPMEAIDGTPVVDIKPVI